MRLAVVGMTTLRESAGCYWVAHVESLFSRVTVSDVVGNLTPALRRVVGHFVTRDVEVGGPPLEGMESDADTTVIVETGAYGGPLVGHHRNIGWRGWGQVLGWLGHRRLVIGWRELGRLLGCWPGAPHFHGTYT